MAITSSFEMTHTLSLELAEDSGRVVLVVNTSFGAHLVCTPTVEPTQNKSIIFFLSPCCRAKIYCEMLRRSNNDKSQMELNGAKKHCGRCNSFLGTLLIGQTIERKIDSNGKKRWAMAVVAPVEGYMELFFEPLEAGLVTSRLSDLLVEIYNDHDWATGNLERLINSYGQIAL